MATNDKLITIPDGIEDGTVLSYDITNEVFIDSGVKAKYGSVFVDADGLNLGNHQIYAAGENIIFRNKSDDKSYYPAWREIDPTGATVSKMTARLYGSPLQPIVRFTDINSVVNNPNFEINVTGDEAVFQLQFTFVQAYTNVIFEILRKDTGRQIWKAVTPHVESGLQKIQLEVPFELKTGDYYFKVYLADETLSPIELRGDEHGNPAYTLYMRPWTDENLATETFVINEISGGHQAAYLDKATYDPNNDGSVTLADKVKGADSIPNDHYYGKNGSGNVGFFPLPEGTITDDVMLKSVYDTKDNGKVDWSTWATKVQGVNSAGSLTYYGKDSTGAIGFFALPEGADEAALKSDIKTNTDAIAVNKAEIDKHETAINGHGTQLATHANLIATNTKNVKIAMDHSESAMNEGLQNRKNAVNALVADVSSAHKTITLKLMSTAGLVDSALIDLSSWFGGVNPPQPGDDHTIYYGFTVKTTLPEDEILRIGTTKDVPSIDSLDVTLTRSTQTASYMWIWLPDAAGTIKGFDFSGFVSVWSSTAVNVAGADGKFYISPNKTSATSIEFEVRV